MTDERLAELRAEVEDLDNHWTAQQAMEDLIAEVDRLRVELARRTKERDDTRHAVCWRAAYGRPGHESRHDYMGAADAAHAFGWGYLYPEESDQ